MTALCHIRRKLLTIQEVIFHLLTMALKSAYYPERRITYTTFCYRGLHCEQRNTGLFFFSFFFSRVCQQKKWSYKWMCAFCSGPTTSLSDWGKPRLGCQLFKGSKIKCCCENVPTTAWNPFCIIFSIFSMTSFNCEFAVVSMQQELQNKWFFPSLCKHWAWFLWKNTDLQLFLKVSTRLVKGGTPAGQMRYYNFSLSWTAAVVTSLHLWVILCPTSSICTDCFSAI